MHLIEERRRLRRRRMMVRIKKLCTRAERTIGWMSMMMMMVDTQDNGISIIKIDSETLFHSTRRFFFCFVFR